jgi:RecB family exonuclease
MLDAGTMLDEIAAQRAADPLGPVTVVAPSHAAALQLRRRLAERGAFAGVRFEPLARVAELLAADTLAARGLVPLARPIGDYLAEQAARQTGGELSAVRDLPGFARVLRQMFARLRRGGVRRPDDVPGALGDWDGHFPEVVRLYGLFRDATATFYDREDLFDAAAEVVAAGQAAFLAELGHLYVFASVVQSAGGARLVDAFRAATTCTTVEDTAANPDHRFLLAPDVASEAREAVRELLGALANGVPPHDVALLHGADPAYAGLLREACERAGVPAAPLPGVSLLETRAGRGLLALIELPGHEYARAAAMDALAIAPLRRFVPRRGADPARTRRAAWERISRAAGITRGLDRWQSGLDVFVADREQEAASPAVQEHEGRQRRLELDAGDAGVLRDVMAELGARLERLRKPLPAGQFCAELRAFMDGYLDPQAAGFDDVAAEVDQLGTIAAVGGMFTLDVFARSLRANLEAAHVRDRKLGDGVLIAGYQLVDGMRFRRVILCGAREGAFPRGPGETPLVDDRTWSRLRETHPYVEDAELRIEREERAAGRAIAAAAESLTWCAPLFEVGGARDCYPSPLMVAAARIADPAIGNGSRLRTRAATPWLRRGTSPLALRLQGIPIDLAELRLRGAVRLRQQRAAVDEAHRRWRAVSMARSRTAAAFTAWDGNLGDIAGERPIELRGAVSPTSLETYGACGFKYFCRSVLGLRAVEEPDERDVMDAATRGTLIHKTLELFFREQHARGRPAEGEAWTDDDLQELLAMLDRQLAEAEARGLRGVELFAGHERRMLRADLTEFLAVDNAFRRETGAIPAEFEAPVPETKVAGVRFRGFVDRIDRAADGRRAWVIDYKTGGKDEYKDFESDPLMGGTRLQLPAYLLAARDAGSASAFYWFISQRGGFDRLEYASTPEREARFRATLEAIVHGIGAGAFPAVPGDYDDFAGKFDNCRFCDFDRMCARRRDDAFADMAGDPALAPWLNVAATAEEDA